MVIFFHSKVTTISFMENLELICHQKQTFYSKPDYNCETLFFCLTFCIVSAKITLVFINFQTEKVINKKEKGKVQHQTSLYQALLLLTLKSSFISQTCYLNNFSLG